MPRPCVVAINICPVAGQKMVPVLRVLAIAGAGLEGDRYCTAQGSWNKDKLGKRQVSLIEFEAIVKASNQTLPFFLSKDTRRNIVTQNIRLMDLIGKEFAIGPVRMRGTKYCDPCDRPDKLSGKKGFKDIFAESAGILAEILTDGVIRIADPIRPV